MSNEASAWFQDQWNAQVTLIYQQKGYMTNGMAMGPTRVDGKQLHFPIAGKGSASVWTKGDEVKPMNATRGEVLLTASEFDAGDYIYQYDLDRMAANELDTVHQTAAMALGRKHDEVLYNLMQATDFTTVPQFFGTYATALTPETVLAARRYLFNQDVPTEDGMLFCGLPPIAFDTLMQKQVFANSQWVGPNIPFGEGMRRRTWQNIHFFELPVNLQSINVNQNKFYMWHRSALGTGYTGEAIKSDFTKEVKRKRWWYQSTISAGACIIQKNGIAEMRIDQSIQPVYT